VKAGIFAMLNGLSTYRAGIQNCCEVIIAVSKLAHPMLLDYQHFPKYVNSFMTVFMRLRSKGGQMKHPFFINLSATRK
jgi:hypothetical protein